MRTLVICLVLLGSCVAQAARPSLIDSALEGFRSHDYYVQVEKDRLLHEPDLNENFINSNLIVPHRMAKLPPDSQVASIQSRIDDRLVLPHSFVRSFVEVAEGEIFARSASATLQILISENGKNGASDLVTRYARESGRRLIQLDSATESPEKLKKEVESAAAGTEPPILVFDNFHSNSQEYVDRLLQLWKNERSAFAKSSIVVILKGEQFRLDLLAEKPIRSLKSLLQGQESSGLVGLTRELVSLSHAVHIVRKPLTVGYYNAILNLWLSKIHPATHRENSNLDPRVIDAMAEAAMAYQNVQGVSAIDELSLVVHAGRLECREILEIGQLDHRHQIAMSQWQVAATALNAAIRQATSGTQP